MRRIFALLITVILMTGLTACTPSTQVASPDGSIQVAVQMNEGQPQYRVVRNGRTVIEASPLGIRLQDAPPMTDRFEVDGVSHTSADETWTPVWGTDSLITNQYREMTVELEETEAPNRQMNLVVRAYDDGIAFRYVWPEQPNLDSLRITSEETGFYFAEDHTAWWIPDDYDGYEWQYRRTRLSAVNDSASALSYNSYLEEDDAGDPIRPSSKADAPGAVNTPITLRSPDESLYLSVHEAALTDYAGMTLQAVPDDALALTSTLVPWPDGVKVKAQTPHRSPWRTVHITETPGELITSHLLLNLNEPSKIEDPSWIEPMTYVGIWWGMHLGKYSWGRQGTHGATTERAKRYIDFAAEHDVGGVLVEGWNQGWESWGGDDVFDFTEPYPDFDLAEVAAYAESNGVELIGHHETGGDVPSYERQLDAAFELYDSLDVNAVKTGYAGMIRPESQHHHGQWMVNHYREVVKKAAEHQIAIDAHEPIKPTGTARTWPNMMTREGVRGMEYNAWSVGNPPSHTLTLPFTRMVAGPLDYTPGIFRLTGGDYTPGHRVYTTLSKQLANMVVLYSPMQMAADLIENYEDHDAFEFIERVPADWGESHVLNARIGESITIARREKGSARWFVGSTTNEDARELDVPLSFLEDGQTYVAHVFEDVPEQDYETNPQAYRIHRVLVSSDDTLTADLGRSGGQAVALVPATDDDMQRYETLGE